MDWLLRDKKIVISEAKKNGFAISFRAANIFTVPGKIPLNRVKVIGDEELGDPERKLYYFFDLDKNTLSIYNSYRKLYGLTIKKVKIKKDVVIVKIKHKTENYVLWVDLATGDYKEVRYDKKNKVSTIQIHEAVFMYNKY